MNESVIKSVLLLIYGVGFSLQQIETDDYMKREHSLIKPYMGNLHNLNFDQLINI